MVKNAVVMRFEMDYNDPYTIAQYIEFQVTPEGDVKVNTFEVS